MAPVGFDPTRPDPSAPDDPCRRPPPPELRAGIDQFNARQFFRCHETLEQIWLADRTPIRRLYQGILQIGVGFYHLERGNYRGATGLLDSGLGYLSAFPPICQGVAVGRLIGDARRARTRLAELGPTRIAEFEADLIPKIRLADQPTD